ncbi:MAG: O-antigen ligase family protein [Anaerolineae bacterium]
MLSAPRGSASVAGALRATVQFPRRVGLAAAALGVALALLPLSWAAALLGGGAAALLLLSRTHLALPLLAFAIPFGSLWEVEAGVVSVGATEAVLIAVLAVWAAGLGAERRVPAKPPLAIPLLLFWVVLALSVVAAGSLALSLKGLLVWLEVVLVYWIAYDWLDLPRARGLAAAMILAASLEAGLGGMEFLRGTGPEAFALPGGFSRASGTFGQPNPFGGYLAMVLPISLALSLGPTHGLPRWVRGLALAGVAFLGGGLLASWSRGAWLAAGAASMVVAAGGVISRTFDRLRALATAGLVAAAAGLAIVTGGRLLGTIAGRLGELIPYIGAGDVRYLAVTEENFALVDRLAHWQAAVAMVSNNPILGVGIGNYPAAYPQFAVPGWPDALGHAHNYYLNVAAEAGLLGLAGYLSLWVGIALLAWRALRRARGGWRPLGLGAAAGLAALAVHSGFDNLFVHGLNIQFALLVALVAAAARDRPRGVRG